MDTEIGDEMTDDPSCMICGSDLEDNGRLCNACIKAAVKDASENDRLKKDHGGEGCAKCGGRGYNTVFGGGFGGTEECSKCNGIGWLMTRKEIAAIAPHDLGEYENVRLRSEVARLKWDIEMTNKTCAALGEGLASWRTSAKLNELDKNALAESLQLENKLRLAAEMSASVFKGELNLIRMIEPFETNEEAVVNLNNNLPGWGWDIAQDGPNQGSIVSSREGVEPIIVEVIGERVWCARNCEARLGITGISTKAVDAVRRFLWNNNMKA